LKSRTERNERKGVEEKKGRDRKKFAKEGPLDSGEGWEMGEKRGLRTRGKGRDRLHRKKAPREPREKRELLRERNSRSKKKPSSRGGEGGGGWRGRKSQGSRCFAGVE